MGKRAGRREGGGRVGEEVGDGLTAGWPGVGGRLAGGWRRVGGGGCGEVENLLERCWKGVGKLFVKC